MTRHNYEMKYSLEAATKIIEAAGPCRFTGYRWRKVFLDHVLAHGAQTSASWCGVRAGRTTPPRLKDETTYDQCVEAVLTVDNGKLMMVLTINDGDMVNGNPTAARCRFAGELKAMCPEVDQAVTNAFRMLVDVEVDRREAARIARLRAEVEAQFTRDYDA